MKLFIIFFFVYFFYKKYQKMLFLDIPPHIDFSFFTQNPYHLKKGVFNNC